MVIFNFFLAFIEEERTDFYLSVKEQGVWTVTHYFFL